MHKFRDVIFLVARSNKKAIKTGTGYFASPAELSIFSNFSFTLWTDLERKKFEIHQAFITKPNIILATVEAGDGEKSIENECFDLCKNFCNYQNVK